MEKVYKSKVGLELVLPVAIILAGAATILILNGAWSAVIVVSGVIALTSIIFSKTYYTINGEILKIRSGFLYRKNIDIKSIRKISETGNPLSAPAISLDRLEIEYNKFDSVLISPARKKDFIHDLKKVNAAIEIRFKEKSSNVQA